MAKTRLDTELVGSILRGTFVSDGGASSFRLNLLAQIDAFCAHAEGDEAVRAAIITGTGRTFSIGTDLRQIERELANFVQFRTCLNAFNATMNRLERLPVPTNTAVIGITRAGGIEIVPTCDLALIADDAWIGGVHSAQFAIPAGGSTQRLPRRIGMPRAKDLISSGRFLTAAEAVDWGLYHAVVAPGDLIAAAERLLATYVDKPRACLAESKALMLRSDPMAIGDGVELEQQTFLHYVQNDPFVRDAFTAFRNRKTQAAPDR